MENKLEPQACSGQWAGLPGVADKIPKFIRREHHGALGVSAMGVQRGGGASGSLLCFRSPLP